MCVGGRRGAEDMWGGGVTEAVRMTRGLETAHAYCEGTVGGTVLLSLYSPFPTTVIGCNRFNYQSNL